MHSFSWCLLRTISLSLIVGTLVTTAWAQETGFQSAEFLVNTFVLGSQEQPDVAVAQGGSFVVVWASQDQAPPGWDVFAQRFGVDGVPLGGEFQVNVFNAGDQRTPAVAIAADGRFVVVWESVGQDGDGLGVFGQRFAPDGSRVGPEFPLHTSTAGTQQSPAVAMNGAGDFVVAWESNGGQNSWHALARSFGADGTPVTGEIPVEAAADCAFQTPQPDVAIDGGGAFSVTWREIPSCLASTGQLLARQYDAGGHPLGSAFAIASGDFMIVPAVAANGSGELAVAWEEQLYTPDFEPYYLPFASRRTPGGAAVGDEWQSTVADFYNENPSIAIDGSGRFIALWNVDPTGGVRARRFDASAQLVGAEFWIAATRNIGPAAASTDAAGETIAVWRHDPNGTDQGDIHARRICASLTVTGALGGVACEGGALAQHVAAIGKSPLAYQWRRNGIALVDGAGTSGAHTPTLVIDPLATGDAGSYDCVVTDGCAGIQTALSPAGALSVNVRPAEVAGLLLSKASGGTELRFLWTDVAGADDYVVHADAIASGGFATVAGSAASGVFGLTIPMPAGNVYYLVNGRDAQCGEGP